MAESVNGERHESNFEEFDFRIEVESNGDVWASFHESGRCVFTCSLRDLRECMRFAIKHAGNQ